MAHYVEIEEPDIRERSAMAHLPPFAPLTCQFSSDCEGLS